MKQETNIPFCLLSVLGIIFVVDGHLNHSFFDIGGVIPYYAFHMPLFVFISGYFFRMKEGESLWRRVSEALKGSLRMVGNHL